MIGELTNHLWQSTLFAVAAGLLTTAFRGNKAQVRHWLWFSASMKFLLPFALLMSLGSLLERTPSLPKIAVPAVSPTILQIAEPFSVDASFAPPAKHAIDWAPIAMFLWVCGFAAMVVIRFRGWLRIRAAVRASAVIDLLSSVEVRAAPGLLEPGVVGFFRPVLLVPAGIAERLTPLQLQAVLAHETCHVRRRDNLTSAIHMMVEAIFWFHPFVWYIGARLVEERERACDEAVLSLGGEPRDYAEGILSVCKHYVESPLVCVSGVTGANLKQRIEAIIANRTGRRLNRVKKFALASAGVAVLTGPVVLGLMVGIGHSIVRAQSPLAVPAPVSVLAQTTSPVAPAVTPPAPSPIQDHRQIALLFDFGAMTSDEQSRVRQSAITFVHDRMGPSDRVAVMTAEDGRVLVVNDFTDDKSLLESAILRLNPSAAGGSPLSGIEGAVKVLGALPGKKQLFYFAATIPQGADNQAEIDETVSAAQLANVALYPVELRAATAQIALAWGPIRRSMASQYDDTDRRRLEYAQLNFGSASTLMGRTYIKYGAPDQIDGQIWRYNYLEDFGGRAEFEFGPGNNGRNRHINWPPPVATYPGVPGAALPLVETLNREHIEPVITNAIAGLPGRHASFQIYPGPVYRALSVPLDSLSGLVEVVAEIMPRSNPPATGQPIAEVRDGVQAAAGTYEATFTLAPGSYVCALIVKEQATGRTYGEVINFEVK